MNLPIQTESFIENRKTRDEYIDKINVLDRVKKLALLPDNEHATVTTVADYYQVDYKAITSILNRHKKEFESDGVHTISSKDEAFFKLQKALPNKQYVVKLIPKRSVLRVGMLLRDSEVSQTIREYLLRAEESLSIEKKNEILGGWDDNEIALIEKSINDEIALGNTKMSGIRLASKLLNRNANNVQQKYYQIKNKYGSLHNYLVEKNVIYLNNEPTESSIQPQIQLNIEQTIADRLEAVVNSMKANTGLVSQINELKLEIADLKNQLIMKDALLEGKETQISNKIKLNNKLKKENSDLEHKLRFISQVIVSSKVVDNTQIGSRDTKKYILKNGVIETN
ncbi:hypothetical protein [Paenibacillus illinoisensis]|uniref:Uncharacterized protein n=1 Tax=Paenibacillus illinoisensis TaxID=59845 RepID=A0A2W0CDY7_9BACL|nr:hypothetical protein [Paenibacillus illinoisensis]PYY28322.1 Uncharacterized protein PIL02S_03473 [Paenibacillus illinoisensis]